MAVADVVVKFILTMTAFSKEVHESVWYLLFFMVFFPDLMVFDLVSKALMSEYILLKTEQHTATYEPTLC